MNCRFDEAIERTTARAKAALHYVSTAGLFALLACAIACGDAPRVTSEANGNAPQSAPGEIKYTAPSGWIAEKISSNMRVAQYKLPRVQDDQDDGQLVLYYFGAGQGGSAQANVDRWVGQIQQPNGAGSKDAARIEKLTVNGLNVTMVDVSGTYTAEMAPGSSTHHNSPGYRLRAAVIETPRGSYYVKLVGPEKTIAKW